jgi:hypothetical protein
MRLMNLVGWFADQHAMLLSFCGDMSMAHCRERQLFGNVWLTDEIDGRRRLVR